MNEIYTPAMSQTYLFTGDAHATHLTTHTPNTMTVGSNNWYEFSLAASTI